MKLITLTISLLYAQYSFSQDLRLGQSSPEINWKNIENEFVKIVYPDFLKSDAIYIANLIENYSSVVGKSYAIDKPKKVTILLRAEAAQPNGFAALSPRRSEWYSPGGIFPFVGMSEWYQTLSIHEYRHIIQYDNFNQNTAKILDYLFGDNGRAVALFSGLQPWFFEGDAVWAETKYSDAGRGRSPRFLARLKALVLSNQTPTYDEFVNGTYNNKIPNHYVFGYVLISSATQKFGDDFWKKVTKDIAVFPHPLRLYSSFEKFSGISFLDFFNQTMNELKEAWSSDKFDTVNPPQFSNKFHYQKGNDFLYFIETNLDELPTIYKQKNEKKVKIAQILFSESINQLHISKDKAVYTEYLPHPRYGFKGSSELVLLNLKNGEKTKVTKGRRFYNPQLNKSASKIIATEFTSDHKWKIVEFTTQGRLIQSFSLEKHEPAQINYLSDNQAVAIVNSTIGEKSIVIIDLETHKIIQTLLPFSRNNINSLYSDENQNIVFEAQLNGKDEIFKFSTFKELSQCTFSKIGSYLPSISRSTIYFSFVGQNGLELGTTELKECKSISINKLVNYNYLGDGPSDHYNDFPLRKIENHKSYFTKNAKAYKEKDHGDFDSRLFIPHSWSFIGGRGFEVSANTDNYLGTTSISAMIGSSSEESQSYSTLSFNYKKFWPLFSILASKTNRSSREYGSSKDSQWVDEQAGLNIYLPYILKDGLYNFQSGINLGGAYHNASNFRFDQNKLALKDRHHHESYVEFSFNFHKDAANNSLKSPLKLTYNLQYRNAENISKEQNNSYIVQNQVSISLPGLSQHHLIRPSFTHQKEKGTFNFLPINMSPAGYVFSRGYTYNKVDEFQKTSLNYLFPTAKPDWNLSGWYYLRRLTTNFFYDSTLISSPLEDSRLESYGAEFEFESKFLRVLPVTFGFRAMRKNKTEEDIGEFYLATDYSF